MTEISVIIPTCNRPQYLNRTLSSLTNQKTEVNYEILVLDDFGKDQKARDIALFWSQKVSVRYLKPSDYGMKNGRTRIRNLGIREAKGNILVFLDDDMIVSPSFIEEHYKSHLKNNKNVVLGYRYYLKLSSKFLEYVNPVNIIGNPAVMGHLPTVKDEREDIYKLCKGDLNSLPAPWVLLYSNNCSIRKDLLLAAGGGGFNELFLGEWGGEDVELGYRLFRAGGRYVLNRQAIGYHQWHYVNWRKNIRSLKVNLQKLYTTHPVIDMELYMDYIETGLDNFLTDLSHYTNVNGNYPFSAWDRAADAEKLGSRLPVTKDESVLLLGLGKGKILEYIKPEACVDLRENVVNSSSDKHRKMVRHRLLGTHVPYSGGRFDHVIINDFLSMLPRYHWKLIFKEAFRVAKKTVFFATQLKTLNTMLGKKSNSLTVEKALQEELRAVFGLNTFPGIKLKTEIIDGLVILSLTKTITLPSIAQSIPNHLIVIADSGMADSFCDHAVELVLALTRKGCRVALQLEDYHTAGLIQVKKLPAWERYTREEQMLLNEALTTDLRGEKQHFPQLSLTGQSHYFDQRIEWLRSKTIGILSSPFIHSLNDQVDAVWCPGQSLLDSFLKSGGSPGKARLIPVGISDSLAKNIDVPNRNNRQKFRFVAVGTIEKSDGIDILLEAFCKGFGRIPNAELIVKILPLKGRESIHKLRDHNRTAQMEHVKHIEQAKALFRYRMDRWRRFVRDKKFDSSRIKFQIVGEDLRSWPLYFEDAHCYVQPHRADPIGERVVQAMGLGIPTIVTSRYLPDQLKLSGMNYLIRSNEVTAAESEWSSQVVYTRWAEPNVDHLIRLMKYAYMNEKEGRNRGMVAREYILKNYTWNNIADVVLKNLHELMNLQLNSNKSSPLAELFSSLKEKGLINIEEEAYERK